MAWIESHQSLAKHPKTKRLARELGESVPSAIGRLHLLWWWALDYAPDGYLDKFDEFDIADAIEWTGDVNIIDALKRSRFVDSDMYLHDWHEYAGRLISQREKNAERKRKSRGRHADVTETGDGVTGLPTQPTNPTNLTQPDQPTGHQTSSSESGKIIRLYESEGFGNITQFVGQEIENLMSEYPVEWIVRSMKEAVGANKRTLQYMRGCLRNWKAEGGPKERANGNTGKTTSTKERDPRYSAFYELFPDA